MTAYPKAVAEGWHPVATLAELTGRSKPLSRELMDKPLAVFLTAGGPAVLIDRCPHRNMPLSHGQICAGEVECPYHGWRFAGDGRCTLTPGSEQPARQGAEALPVAVAAGLVFTTLAKAPQPFPALPHPVGIEGFDTFLWPVRPSRARLADAIENLLDPAHPHFLHPGIVRSRSARRPVDVTVRITANSAEAIYVENARASAWMPRLLEGQRVTSIGRFFPPSTGQVAFEGKSGLKLAITVFFVPEAQDRVRPFAHFATPRGAVPAFLKEALLRAFHIPVLAQDQAALRRQAENIQRFGGPRYAIGPLDLLFPAIQQLLNGEKPDETDSRLVLNL